MGGAVWFEKPSPPSIFSAETSPKTGDSPQNLLNFIFNLFMTLLWGFKAIPSANNLNQAKKPGEFVKDLLKQKHKQKYADQAATFERLQSRNINAMCIVCFRGKNRCQYIRTGKRLCGTNRSFVRSSNKFHDLS